MPWVRSLTAVIMAFGMVGSALAQGIPGRCVVGEDANGNPNGACGTGSGSDDHDYAPTGHLKANPLSFAVTGVAVTAAAPLCALQCALGDCSCVGRSAQMLQDTNPLKGLMPAPGTSLFNQPANPPNVQLNASTPTSATNPTASAQAVSNSYDNRVAAIAPSTEGAKAGAGFGFDTNPRTPGAPLNFSAVGAAGNPTVTAVNNFLANDTRYRTDLQSHQATLATAMNDRTVDAGRLNGLQAQLNTDRNNIARNQLDLYHFVVQPGVQPQLPAAVQQQVRYALDKPAQ